MRKYLKIIILLVMFIPFMNIKAYSYCSTSDAIRYQKLASNIGYNYTYEELENDAIFTIKLYNVHKELFIKDVINDKLYYPDTNKDLSEIVISNFKSGYAYGFQIYTTLNGCEDRNFYSLYITIPKYNKFYKYDECKNIPEFTYCQKWASFNLSEEQFIEEVKKYKNKDNQEEEKKEDINVNTILDFILKYNYYFASG